VCWSHDPAQILNQSLPDMVDFGLIIPAVSLMRRTEQILSECFTTSGVAKEKGPGVSRAGALF
jgi:hypothetical protein